MEEKTNKEEIKERLNDEETKMKENCKGCKCYLKRFCTDHANLIDCWANHQGEKSND